MKTEKWSENDEINEDRDDKSKNLIQDENLWGLSKNAGHSLRTSRVVLLRLFKIGLIKLLGFFGGVVDPLGQGHELGGLRGVVVVDAVADGHSHHFGVRFHQPEERQGLLIIFAEGEGIFDLLGDGWGKELVEGVQPKPPGGVLVERVMASGHQSGKRTEVLQVSLE